ncbi:hypothetical protein V1506DRAFT_509025 [Lipomyces tetrasporus]
MKPETTRKIDTGMARYSEGGLTFSPDNLPKASTRHQLINAFITTCVPDSELRMGRSGPWLVLLPQFLMRTKALETASLAISAAALGRVHNDTTLINESPKLYTQGLRELQNALWNPKLMYDDETLAACLSLSLYEVMECPGDAYNAFLWPFALKQSFSASRRKGREFLSSPLWVQGPWKGSPKRVLDRLIDCLAMGPIIFQQTERFRTLRSKPLLDLALEIVDHCWALDKALRGIYEDLERETAGSLYWPTLSQGQNVAYDPAFGNVFPVAFQFQDLNTARTLMLYWSLAVMVWSGFCALYELIATIEIDPVDAFCPEYQDCVDPNSCACRRLVPISSGSLRYDVTKSHRSAIALIT